MTLCKTISSSPEPRNQLETVQNLNKNTQSVFFPYKVHLKFKSHSAATEGVGCCQEKLASEDSQCVWGTVDECHADI